MPSCHSPRPWNVLLVTLDTTRADFLGCYGKESARTPHLDGLAAQGFLFENAYASNPVTQPSHATILTGTYPMLHGVRDNLLFRLPEERQTLAELLKAQGYETAAAVGGFPLTREFGTAQGFDFYDDDLEADRLDHRGRPAERRRPTWYDERPAAHVNDAILPWLRQDRAAPFFVWLHYWDPHEPHIAPDPYGQIFAHDPYQGEIAYADQSLGTILRELEARGEAQRTLIVVTADHGEGRREHREMTHAFLAYDTTLRVPLIVRLPGLLRPETDRRIAQRVGTVDIVPTVLDLLGLPVPAEVQGRSLARLMRGQSDDERRDYYAESLSPRLSHGIGELRVLYRGPFKYIHGPRPELFHLGKDPRELHDLADELTEQRQNFAAALGEFVGRHRSTAAAEATYEASEETRRKLAALGYLDAGGDRRPTVSEELRSDGVAPQDRVEDINLAGGLRRQLGAGQFRLARRTAEKLLEVAPQNAYYRAQLAAAHLGLRQIEEAAGVVDGSEVVSTANIEVFSRVAYSLFESGQRQRGLAMARRFVAALETAESRLMLGRMLRTRGDVAGFIRELERVLELDPKNRRARLDLIEHHTEEESFAEAEDQVRLLLASYPADVEGLLAYARLLHRGQRPTEALAPAERALRLAPRLCDAHLERLAILVALGDTGDAAAARQTLERVCRDPQSRAQAQEMMEDV